jgi:hypothetical protein
MKTSKILLLPLKKGNEEIQGKVKAVKLLKLIIVVFILSWITILPSCSVLVRTPGVNIQSERSSGHGHSERSGHGHKH